MEIAWQNWPFKIGLGLFDLKQLLVDSGIIVHWNEKVTLISHKAAEIIEMYSKDGDSLEYAAIVSAL